MLRLRVEVAGGDELARNMRRLADSARDRLEQALDESANQLRDAAVVSILHDEKTGRVYEKYDPRRTHVASAPGEAPASDTGFLVNHIVVDRTELPQLEVGVASLAPYSEALEYGTRRMKARPFLRPALQRYELAIIARLEAAVRFAVRTMRRR
jgi:HK97 gp10 family phage protein